MTDPWRYACPECGSRSVIKKVPTDLHRCKTCLATDFDAVDLKHERDPKHPIEGSA